jgi:dethiobiotin synthetase
VTAGLFITGTDTGVGKTYFTALLLAALRRQGIAAAAFKPVACGVGGRNDAKLYRRLMNNEVPLDAINPVYLRRPLAPLVAARLENRRIDLRKVFSSYELLVANHQPILIEGAGGLLVPIKRNYFVSDLAKQFGLPVVIVARLGLGTINHTLLTVRQAQRAGLRVKGIVLNDLAGTRRGLAERTNVEVVPELCGVPLLAVVRHGQQRIEAEIFAKLRGLTKGVS